MGGMPEGSVTTRIMWASENYMTEDFLHNENKGADKRVNRRHVALGASLVPNSSGLKGRKRL